MFIEFDEDDDDEEADDEEDEDYEDKWRGKYRKHTFLGVLEIHFLKKSSLLLSP